MLEARAAPRARRRGGLRPPPRRRALVVSRALLRPDGGQRAVAGWSLQAIEAAVDEARGGRRALPAVALVGFSQGACIVAEHLARRPEPYGAAAILTGALFGTPRRRPDAGGLARRPAHVLRDRRGDDWIPVDAVRETVEWPSSAPARAASCTFTTTRSTGSTTTRSSPSVPCSPTSWSAPHDRCLSRRRRPHALRALSRRPRRLPTRRPRRARPRRRARARRRPPRRGRRGHLRRRQPGRRGQPQRRAHGRPAGRPAGRGAGLHRQPPVRQQPAGRRLRGAADPQPARPTSSWRAASSR